MKYTNEIIIDKNVNEVVKLFDSVENLYKWMPDLESFHHVSGTPGEVGAKSILKFKMGKREFEMVETITAKNLPSDFSGTYEMKGTLNIVKNSFIVISDSQTRYVSENEFQFKGLFMKLMAFAIPGSFRKQSYKYMQLFKEFAESQ